VDEEFPTELTRLAVAWHVPDVRHEDIPALDLLASILGDGRSARLYRALREEQGIVHSVGAWCYAPNDSGLFGLSAILDPEKMTEVRAALLAQLNAVVIDGVRPEELDKVRRMRLSGYFGGLATARGRASDIGDSWMACRNTDFSRLYAESLSRVLPADLQRVAREYLREEKTNVVTIHPKGTVRKASEKETAPMRGGIQRRRLENGLRTLICADKRLPLVNIVIGFKGGRLEETSENNGISKLFTRVLLKGTQTRSATQIAEEVESLGGAISADAGKGTMTVGVSVLRQDLEMGLEILSDVVRNAVFPESVLAREKEVQLAGIKAEKEDPFAVAGQVLRRNLLEQHPDGLPALGTPEIIAAIERDALLAFRDQYFVGNNGVLSIFGDVDETSASALAAHYFGGLPSGEEALREPRRPLPLGGSLNVSESIDRQQAIIMVGYRGVDVFHPDETALSLLDEACSDLGSRMFVRIREQLGLAYSVGSSQYSGLACGTFVFYVGTDPLKQTAVLAELKAEILEIAKVGLTEAELSRAKEKALGSMELRNQSPGAFASGCTVDELFGFGAEHYLVEREKIRAVTLEQVRDAAARHFGSSPCVTVVASPESPAL
jgi:zinc protease